MKAMRAMRGPVRPHQAGFTMASLLFVLVVLSALGAAMALFTQRQHMSSAAELAAARAYQAAFAGLEWGSYQVLRNPAPPAAAPACFGSTQLSFGAGTDPALSDFTVTVSCVRTPASGTVSDGASTLAFYELTAVACNQPVGGACPGDAAPAATYVERSLSRRVAR
ncbi:MAG TPA: agglutinin biogenesis protein MshP [Burkholderiaceae bacterium]|nr:agglutinin biogenesis protein MshP [Burkholderiaceae bacterium]